MSKTSGATSKEIDPASVDASLITLVLLVAAGAIAAFIATFWRTPFGPPESWGQFGDYLGGVINPAVGIVTALLVARTLSATRREASETRDKLTEQNRLLQTEVEASKLAVNLAETRQTLDLILADFRSYLRERTYLGPYRVGDLAISGNGLTLHALLMEHQYLMDAIEAQRSKTEFAAIRAAWSRNFFRTIEFLMEINWYLKSYEQAGGSSQITDYYRRRLYGPLEVLVRLNLIDERLAIDLQANDQPFTPGPV